MSKTLLQGVNEVLNRVGVTTQTGGIASFNVPSKQVYIDLAIQVWNETVDQVCDMMGLAHPGEPGSYSVTLVAGQREYDLPSDLVQIRWPLIDQTNGNYIDEYPGGYPQMRIDQQLPDDWTGLPYAAAINPVTSKLRLERAPTSTEGDGAVYDMFYDKDLAMTETDDTFPFSDATFRALIPVVAEGWDRRKRNDFDPVDYGKNLARALNFANKVNRRSHW